MVESESKIRIQQKANIAVISHLSLYMQFSSVLSPQCCRFEKVLHWPGDPALLGLEREQEHQGRRLVSYQFIAQLV